jgi:penicillin-binding protein 2
VVLAFILVCLRLWYLQMETGADMRSLSENNRIRLVRVPAARGVVYDRHGEILIDNRPSFDVVFVPEDARERRREVLAQPRRTSSARRSPTLHQAVRVSAVKRPPYQGIVLRRDVDWQGVVALESHQLDLPACRSRSGRSATTRTVRSRRISSATSARSARASSRRARTATARGSSRQGGLEKAWDQELHGVAGGEQVEVDALGRRMRVLQEVADEPGRRSRSPSTATSRKPPIARSATPTARSSPSTPRAARSSRWSRIPRTTRTSSRAASGATNGARSSRTRSIR